MGTMPGGEQQELDFPRLTQIAILRKCVLVDMMTKDGKTVKAGFAKAVLTQLDGYGGGRECWPALDTIAAGLNRSRRHVIRAIEVLEAASLLVIETKFNPSCGKKINHYRIVWSELQLLDPSATKVPSGHYAPSDQSAPGAEQSAPGSRPKCPRDTQSGTEVIKKYSVPDRSRSVSVNEDDEGEDRERDELLANVPPLADAATRIVAPLPLGRLAGNAFAMLGLVDLGDVGRMVLWFRQALSAREPLTRDTEADLLFVLALARWAYQLDRERVQSPVGKFVSAVRLRQWSRGVRQLEASREQLDKLLTARPDALGERVMSVEMKP